MGLHKSSSLPCKSCSLGFPLQYRVKSKLLDRFSAFSSGLTQFSVTDLSPQPPPPLTLVSMCCSFPQWFVSGWKSLVLMSTRESCVSVALLADGAALPISWFSRIGGLNHEKTLPRRSHKAASSWSAGRRGKVSAGSRWAAQCVVCLAFVALQEEAQKGATVGPKEEEKHQNP